jgi:hypothetical protein
MERATRSSTSPRTLILALLAALALALTTVAGPVAAKPAKAPPGIAKAGPARTVTAMTRNLYLGAELTSILQAYATGNPALIVGAASTTWAQVKASAPPARMAAVAEEIVATKPHAVGLQEVTEFTTYPFSSDSGIDLSGAVTSYDFLDLLMDALAERGADYRVVSGATAENFTSAPIPIVDTDYPFDVDEEENPQPNRAVKLLDRDVIIVRGDVTSTNARNGNFVNVLKPPAAPLVIDRGWGSADLTAKKARFRFVNAHTEAFGPEIIRVAEVNELLAAQAGITQESGALPAVYAGDFNSAAPSGGGYLALLAGGLTDLWTQAPAGRKPADGDTCCQAAHLRNIESELDKRIDLLLGTRGVKAISADRVGDEPVALPGGVRWASDHAGVVADVIIPPKP